MEYNCSYSGINIIDTGNKIRALITSKGLSIKLVCNSLGVSNQCVYKWINGKTLPSLENMYQLSKLLGVPIDTILVGMDDVSYVLPENYVREKKFIQYKLN